MTDYKAPKSNLEDWQEAATKQMKGKPVESLNKTTPEGIEMKALYTSADTADLPYADSLPGLGFRRSQAESCDQAGWWTVMVGSGDSVKVGAPHVAGAKVVAEVVEQTRGPKVIAFKKRRRKASRRKKGHRQDLTRIRITEIVGA